MESLIDRMKHRNPSDLADTIAPSTMIGRGREHAGQPTFRTVRRCTSLFDPPPSDADHRSHLRQITTTVLRAEAEDRRRELLGMVADLRRDPNSWACPEQSLDFALTALDDLVTELEWRRRPRHRLQAR